MFCKYYVVLVDVCIDQWLFYFGFAAPTLTASLAPAVISGDEGSSAIMFNCTPSVVENVASPSYQFTWMKDGSPADLADTRITVCICNYTL